MRYDRVIHLDNLKYKYISVTQSDTKMVVRILYPSTDTAYISGNRILSCERLKWKTINIEDITYTVVAEGVFDLENPLHRSWFQPNSNICFVVNTAFANGDIAVIPCHVFCAGQEKTPDWARRNGYHVVAQLYCWSTTDTVANSPCSFAVDNKGKLFTNIDPQRMRHVDMGWMQRKDRSDFLVIKHNINAEAKEGSILFSVDCTDYLNNPIDVNGIYKIEATAGYLPVNEINMVNGKCEFLWYALMVGKQENITIRLKDSQNYVCKEFTFKLK